ncbi:hypothetical protein PULV_a0503 [Pseudoalteromonas ulvae UL12]|nr:hypothetical protein [Pseudoalteromonas ulvae UL12]
MSNAPIVCAGFYFCTQVVQVKYLIVNKYFYRTELIAFYRVAQRLD